LRFELWDEARWNERRDEWLANEDSATDLPTELETLSL
jgi:MraZ protein